MTDEEFEEVLKVAISITDSEYLADVSEGILKKFFLHTLAREAFNIGYACGLEASDEIDSKSGRTE